MWHRMPAFIRDWSILIVGMLLIVPMMYFASPVGLVIEITRGDGIIRDRQSACGSSANRPVV